jgi:hypothetical protein
VRIQWDPDRDLEFSPQPERAIQIGLAGEAVRQYTNDWIAQISDATGEAREIRSLTSQGRISEALSTLPRIRDYPLTEYLINRIGAAS